MKLSAVGLASSRVASIETVTETGVIASLLRLPSRARDTWFAVWAIGLGPEALQVVVDLGEQLLGVEIGVGGGQLRRFRLGDSRFQEAPVGGPSSIVDLVDLGPAARLVVQLHDGLEEVHVEMKEGVDALQGLEGLLGAVTIEPTRGEGSP